jgi:hypothetical protein
MKRDSVTTAAGGESGERQDDEARTVAGRRDRRVDATIARLMRPTPANGQRDGESDGQAQSGEGVKRSPSRPRHVR